MAAGDFSESHLPDIVARIGELYADPRSNKELDRPIETARGVLESQRVTWNPTLFDGTTCVGVKAAWLKDHYEALYKYEKIKQRFNVKLNDFD